MGVQGAPTLPDGALRGCPLRQGGCATFLCQPLDVLKTRLMNSKGEYQVSGGRSRGPAREDRGDGPVSLFRDVDGPSACDCIPPGRRPQHGPWPRVCV